MIIYIIFIVVVFFFLGASIGSFIGVVIDRLPRKESIVVKSSHCTNCGAKLKWYQNIPVISFIFLKGKCANCGAHIPKKYFYIEIIFGIIGLIIGLIVLQQYLQ